jgi:hypothetical protein
MSSVSVNSSTRSSEYRDLPPSDRKRRTKLVDERFEPADVAGREEVDALRAGDSAEHPGLVHRPGFLPERCDGLREVDLVLLEIDDEGTGRRRPDGDPEERMNPGRDANRVLPQDRRFPGSFAAGDDELLMLAEDARDDPRFRRGRIVKRRERGEVVEVVRVDVLERGS